MFFNKTAEEQCGENGKLQFIERMLEKIQYFGNAAEILYKHPLFVVRIVWESW